MGARTQFSTGRFSPVSVLDVSDLGHFSPGTFQSRVTRTVQGEFSDQNEKKLPFQLIIITIGFMSAGFIIKTALMEWSNNPVITTLGHCPNI